MLLVRAQMIFLRQKTCIFQKFVVNLQPQKYKQKIYTIMEKRFIVTMVGNLGPKEVAKFIAECVKKKIGH